ncbi:MAG TPA: hypothetical protein VN408_12090 [Actinoplanes sp.]|nr:hypothetical protein [Actinoplanes sp.]
MPRRERVAWLSFGVLLAVETVVCALIDLGAPFRDTVAAGVLRSVCYLLPGLLAAAGARRSPRPVRLAWSCLAAGLCAYGAGNLYWYLFVRQMDPEPMATPADAMWLTFYPACGVALALLLRFRLPAVSVPALLDGVIAGAAVSALVSIPVLAVVEPDPHSTLLGLVVNAAYPLGDIALTGCLLGGWALCGWRADRVTGLLLAGTGLFAGLDVVSMLTIWQGLGPLPAMLDPLWITGLAALALAAGQRAGRTWTGRPGAALPAEGDGRRRPPGGRGGGAGPLAAPGSRAGLPGRVPLHRGERRPDGPDHHDGAGDGLPAEPPVARPTPASATCRCCRSAS